MSLTSSIMPVLAVVSERIAALAAQPTAQTAAAIVVAFGAAVPVLIIGLHSYAPGANRGKVSRRLDVVTRVSPYHPSSNTSRDSCVQLHHRRPPPYALLAPGGSRPQSEYFSVSARCISCSQPRCGAPPSAIRTHSCTLPRALSSRLQACWCTTRLRHCRSLVRACSLSCGMRCGSSRCPTTRRSASAPLCSLLQPLHRSVVSHRWR